MLARELISPIIPTVNRMDTTAKALSLMNEFHVSQLPLVEEGEYQCLLEETTMLDWDEPETLLENLTFSHIKPAINGNAHFFEALKLAGDYRLSLVPVVDHGDHYLGAITQENLLTTLAHFNGMHESGGILVLEMDQNDFMLSEIARLAEAEDVHILGIHTFNDNATGKLGVVLKTNRLDLNSFVATLERFRYTIPHRFDEPASGDQLQRNYDLLMNYINM
ncbi:MAG TPA: CBS domain-containing protein [Chitinophagaceae bacterium]|nr:CBS domain-containing protein [Chitinophagaceae bacterium]